MSKRILKVSASLLLAASVLMAGCSAEATETEKKKKKKDKKEKETEETTLDTTEETGEETSSEMTTEETPEETTMPFAPDTSLYEAYITGDAKLVFHAENDLGQYMCLSEVLNDGESYTCKELEAKAVTIDNYSTMKVDGDPEYTYIDCGEDGIPELLETLSISPTTGGETFILSMIIKEIDGELHLCYARDSWSRCYAAIAENGTVVVDGSGGAFTHYVEEEFVDADGQYHYYYGCCQEYCPTQLFVRISPDEYDYVDFSDLDVDEFMVREYWFELEYTERQSFYTYGFYDDVTRSYIADDSQFAADNPYRMKFVPFDLTVYTNTEVQDILNQRAKEIGFPGN